MKGTSTTTKAALHNKGDNNNQDGSSTAVPHVGDVLLDDDEDRLFSERRGLLPLSSKDERKRQRRSIRRQQFDKRLHKLIDDTDDDRTNGSGLWLRPYWLGMGLFFVLFPFWLLDSLKDPVFGMLINGNLELHQPTAKLVSVCWTLFLVCLLEYIAQERQRQQQNNNHGEEEEEEVLFTHDEVLNGGGTWTRMGITTTSSTTTTTTDEMALSRRDRRQYCRSSHQQATNDDDDDDTQRVPSNIFASIGIPYCIFFGLLAYVLQFNPGTSLNNNSNSSSDNNALMMDDRSDSNNQQLWKILGYLVYAAIESYGSIAVATFWSFTNSTLDLQEAETYYGTIIALAQLGAIAGSTMVTVHIWNSITLFIVACLVIVLHIVAMYTYARRFPPSSSSSNMMTTTTNSRGGEVMSLGKDADEYHHNHMDESILSPHFTTTTTTNTATTTKAEPTLWSGIRGILKHNYVLLILGVSCLYEVSLTCLNYQMTLLGWHRFEETPDYNPGKSTVKSMSFTQFMGHYGQMVNISSLALSSLVFPWLIRRFGLKSTLRLFPTLLLLANLIAFVALPGNLAVLFFSMSLLKAMTYSIHDPSKEILYMPTSNAIKFQSKFWIDVVGARFAKAIGSSINHMSGSVSNSIRVASAPSLVTAAALWYVCYRAGTQFEVLVESQAVVGVDDDADPLRLETDYSAEHDDDGDGRGDVEESNQAVELTAL